MHWEHLFHVIKRDLYIKIKIKYTRYAILPTYLYVHIITKTTLSYLRKLSTTFVPSAFLDIVVVFSYKTEKYIS